MGRDIGSSSASRVSKDYGGSVAPSSGADALPTAGAAQKPTDYLERLYKIIPVELTAAYLAISSLLTDRTNMLGNSYTLLAFAVLLTVLTPLYLYRLQNVRSRSQLIVSTVSFPVWAVCISTAVVTMAVPVITPEMITATMVGWVLAAPLLVSST